MHGVDWNIRPIIMWWAYAITLVSAVVLSGATLTSCTGSGAEAASSEAHAPTAAQVVEIVKARFVAEGYHQAGASNLAQYALGRAVGLSVQEPQIDPADMPEEPIFSPQSSTHAILAGHFRDQGIESPELSLMATEALITYSHAVGGTQYQAMGDTFCLVYEGDIWYCEDGLKKRKMVQYIAQDMWDQYTGACLMEAVVCPDLDEEPLTFLTLAQTCLDIPEGTGIQLDVNDDDTWLVPCDQQEYIISYECIDGANAPGDFDCDKIEVNCCHHRNGCDCE